VCPLQNRPIGLATDSSVSIQQTHLAVCRSSCDGNYCSAWSQSITREQPFYHSPGFQDSGSSKTAARHGRGGPRQWTTVNQSHHAEQQPVACDSDVATAHANGRPAPTCFWPADSLTTRANFELFPRLSHRCRSTPVDNTGWSCPPSNDCWSDFETTMDSWCNANSNCVDRYQLINGHYCQPIAADTFHLQGRI